jgi:STE24 endopeptidase
MRILILAGVLIYVALFVVTTFVPSGSARREAEKYFTEEEIDRGLRFSFQRRLLYWPSVGIHLGILTAIVCTGFSRRLADTFAAWTGNRWFLTILLVGWFCLLVDEAVSLPFGLARLELLRAWGMTRRPIPSWLADRALGLAVTAVFQSVILIGLFVLIRYFPRVWWLLASLGGVFLGVGLAFILPIWIEPLFNTFTPLDKTEWAYLNAPVEALLRRGGIPSEQIFVVDASRRSSHTNAYFTGFGPTRRIVLYDTLLRNYTQPRPVTAASMVALAGSPGALLPVVSFAEANLTEGRYELEAILAHEMGHWQHNHIVKGLALASLGALLGLYLLARILRRVVHVGLIYSPHDPAAVPLIWLLWTLVPWVAAPVQNAISRHFERQADQASLETVGRPDLFIQAEKRLVRDNISNVANHPVAVWLFATHPTSVEQIRMAEEWRAKHGDKPLQPGDNQ